MSCGSTSGCS